MIRRFSLICITFLFAAGSFAYGDEASKIAKINDFFKVAKLDQSLLQSLTTAGNQIRAAAFQKNSQSKLSPEQQKLADEFQTKVGQLVSQALSWDDLKPAYVKLYAQAFTESEIDGILAFYKSPSGQAMISKAPGVLTQASQLSRQRITDLQPKLQQLSREYSLRMKAIQPQK